MGCEEPAETFVRTMAALGDRLGPLLFVEVRHKSWLGSDLTTMLRENGAALTLIDYPRIPRMEEATGEAVRRDAA